MKHMKFLFLTMLMITLTPTTTHAQDPEPRDVSVSEAKEMLSKGATLIDVRERGEVAEVAYGVENVINIPLSQLAGLMSEIPTDRPLVIACQSGGRSHQASVILMESGYADLVNMDGGMNAWTDKGFAVTKGGKPGQAACCSGQKSRERKRDGSGSGADPKKKK